MGFSFFLFLFSFLFACKNAKEKNALPVLNTNFLTPSLPEPKTSPSFKDEFSRTTSRIMCEEIQTIIYSDYVFSFCLDQVKEFVKDDLPKKSEVNNLDMVAVLCREIPFSLADKKTKRKIRSINYLHESSDLGGQKVFTIEQHNGKYDTSLQIMRVEWIR